MKSYLTCEILIFPTPHASVIVRDPNNPKKLLYGTNGLISEQAKDVQRYFIYLVYKNQLIATNDPFSNTAKLPNEFLQFYCRLNGLDCVDVLFKNPKFLFHDFEGTKWSRILYQPLTNVNEIIKIRPCRKFKTNTFIHEKI
jgi:hypothetical protein